MSAPSAAGDAAPELHGGAAARSAGARSLAGAESPASDGWLFLAAGVIGVLAAFANVVFHAAVDGAHELFFGLLGGSLGIGPVRANPDVFRDGWAALPERWWLVPLLPMAGMAVLAVLGMLFPGEIHGYGLPRFLEIVNVKGGYIRRRWITLKTLASAITLGSGMSAGVEGPIAQIGGAIGSTVSRVLRPSPERLRVLIAAGSAAAVAATFGAPIAGVMFAEEVVLLGQSQLSSLMLLVVAAGVATVASQGLAGYHTVLSAPVFEFPLDHELVFYLLLGIASGPVAVAFLRCFYAIKDRVHVSRIPEALRPVVGAMIVGSALVVFPQIAGSGYGIINAFFESGVEARLLLSLAFVKLVMTGVTLGFGGSGGVFAPVMFIGAAFGSGFGAVVNSVSPGMLGHPGAFGLVGMGTLLAAATHAPMTAIFLLFELTRDYDVVVPIMVSSVAATLVARRLEPESIDEYELARRGLHLHSDGRMRVLRQFYVHGLVDRDVVAVAEDAAVAELVRLVAKSRHATLPVVDGAGRFVGVVGMEDLRTVLLDSESWERRRVSELLRRDVPVLRLGDSLFDALQLVVAHGIEEVPVIEDGVTGAVAGLLKRSELQRFWQQRLLAREMPG